MMNLNISGLNERVYRPSTLAQAAAADDLSTCRSVPDDDCESVGDTEGTNSGFFNVYDVTFFVLGCHIMLKVLKIRGNQIKKDRKLDVVPV